MLLSLVGKYLRAMSLILSRCFSFSRPRYIYNLLKKLVAFMPENGDYKDYCYTSFLAEGCKPFAEINVG